MFVFLFRILFYRKSYQYEEHDKYEKVFHLCKIDIFNFKLFSLVMLYKSQLTKTIEIVKLDEIIQKTKNNRL